MLPRGDASRLHGAISTSAFGLGPREVVLPALEGGLVELVPSTRVGALRFVSLGAESGAN